MGNWFTSATAYASFRYKNYFGLKHKQIPAYLLQKVTNDSIIIDCGANIGKVSHPLVQYNADIHCFEPHPIAFEKLKERFNNRTNVKVYNAAVGTKAQKARLFKHVSSNQDELKYSTASSLYAYKTNINPEDYYEVDVIDFIGFIDSFNKRVFIVKIDIEGGEIELVNQLIDKGAHEKIDYLFVETHERKTPELLPSTLQLKKGIKQLGIKNIYLNWT